MGPGSNKNTTTKASDRYRAALNASQTGGTEVNQVVHAPIPKIEEDEVDTPQAPTLPKPKQPAQQETSAELKKDPEAKIGKKKPKPGASQKTIYFSVTQSKNLRDIRRKLEDIFEVDINPQDIVRYLAEYADIKQFGHFGEFLEASE